MTVVSIVPQKAALKRETQLPTHPEVNIGLLGASRIAHRAVIEPSHSILQAIVYAVASRDHQRARAYAAKYDIPQAHRSYEALLEDPKVEAVYISLPNSLHAYWTIRALMKGKHVLCEKPLAANAAEAQLMATVATESGLTLAEAFHYRFHPLFTRIKEILRSGELGVIRHLKASLCLPQLNPNRIFYRYELSGGAVMDLGGYPISFLRNMAGMEPRLIHVQSLLASAEVDRYMEADLEFPGGITGKMICSLFSRRLLDSSAEIYGTEGELRILNPFHPHWYHRLSVRSSLGARNEQVPGQTTYIHQLRCFLGAIRGQVQLPAGPADAVANMQVIDSIYEKAGLRCRGRQFIHLRMRRIPNKVSILDPAGFLK